MQITYTLMFLLVSVSMVISKKINTKCCQGCGRGKNLYTTLLRRKTGIDVISIITEFLQEITN